MSALLFRITGRIGGFNQSFRFVFELEAESCTSLQKVNNAEFHVTPEVFAR
jgi:hypothetical protein